MQKVRWQGISWARHPVQSHPRGQRMWRMATERVQRTCHSSVSPKRLNVSYIWRHMVQRPWKSYQIYPNISTMHGCFHLSNFWGMVCSSWYSNKTDRMYVRLCSALIKIVTMDFGYPYAIAWGVRDMALPTTGSLGNVRSLDAAQHTYHLHRADESTCCNAKLQKNTANWNLKK